VADYRDRIGVLVMAVLLALVVQRLVELPTRTIYTIILGSPAVLNFTTATVFAALMVGLVALGTDGVVRMHPRAAAGELTGTWVFWALPCALVIVAAQLLPLAPTRLIWLGGLLLTGLLLTLAEAAAYRTIDPMAPGARRSRGFLTFLTFAVAVVLFLVAYRTRARSLLSATWVLGVSGLLALELLRETGRPLRQILTYAAITGLVSGEATWALNYWRATSLSGGLLLLLGFYLLVGLAQQGIQGRLTRRVASEFALVAVLVLALVWYLETYSPLG
jgi:hypothetical protein